jgi:outer membrane protein TolC
LPIFTGGSRLQEIQKSKIQAGDKQKIFEQAHLQASIANRNLVIQYNTSYAAFEKARQTLALYRANNFHAQRLWNEGMISLDERLKYYNDYLNYQSIYFQAMSDLLIQYYSLQVRKAIF